MRTVILENCNFSPIETLCPDTLQKLHIVKNDIRVKSVQKFLDVILSQSVLPLFQNTIAKARHQQREIIPRVNFSIDKHLERLLEQEKSKATTTEKTEGNEDPKAEIPEITFQEYALQRAKYVEDGHGTPPSH